MHSRPLYPGSNLSRPSFLNRTRVIFLVLTIYSSAVILFTIIYFLYHIWNSLSNRARTIPFDSSAPLKLQRFCYKDLKNATDDFDDANIIGKGGSGTVFRGIVRDGKLFAIKRLDTLSLQTEREFQNELQILGGLRSPFLVTLLGYRVEKNKFDVILDVAKALEFLNFRCDPPVIHGDIKPSNVSLDSDYRAKISYFGLSRIKVEGEFGVDLFSQDLGRSQELWKSQELFGTLGGTTGEQTPATRTPMKESNNTEVEFALALQTYSSSKNRKKCYNVRALSLSSLNFNANLASDSDCKNGINGKGKEVACVDTGGDDWNTKFVPYDDELGSIDHSKELNSSANLGADEAAGTPASMKQWGRD
ncbi:putative receptor-like protein kinase [Hibiscus syriacus]|uniref:non-specific serine/threonine protein kinase n=1 Tax=Hibiscus syriacus TaxID=106335 RepID=A0A6A2WGI5_HIBSY|nr:putative receptor-like protein kinase [Hibiscus syriacus]